MWIAVVPLVLMWSWVDTVKPVARPMTGLMVLPVP